MAPICPWGCRPPSGSFAAMASPRAVRADDGRQADDRPSAEPSERGQDRILSVRGRPERFRGESRIDEGFGRLRQGGGQTRKILRKIALLAKKKKFQNSTGKRFTNFSQGGIIKAQSRSGTDFTASVSNRSSFSPLSYARRAESFSRFCSSCISGPFEVRRRAPMP